MNHSEIVKSKIIPRENIKHLVGRLHYFQKKIVFTNGCFDIMHMGHVDYLAKAADHGDFLIVGLNSDASFKLLRKSPNRPLQDENSRAIVLAGLGFVSAVVLFDEATPEELIRIIKPGILVKGADYDADEKDPGNKKFIVGSDFVRENNGIVKTIEFVPGYSTSAIEKKIIQFPQ
jgi:rfaE bifunctional protein nucleotidyltransferase chain/domain